jgi:YidC/Oxa1 family membrane protein insertase
MLVQMPVWIALYQSVIRVLAVAPEDFLNLSKHLYTAWPQVFSLVPLENRFLWLDLAMPDRLLILPILVGATMWVVQKMTAVPNPDPKQQAQGQMMLWMMPVMFTLLSLQFPSGLAIYWITSNIISIVMQYYVTGWGGLFPNRAGGGAPDRKSTKRIARQKDPLEESDISADISVEDTVGEEELTNGQSGDQRQDRGGSNAGRPRTTRRNPRGSKGYRRKRR